MKIRHVGLIGAALLAVFLAAFLAAGQKNDQAELALKAAIKTETVDGNLKGAIEQYKKIAAQPGAGRATVATALLRMGQCHEKLGNAEARTAYERLVRDYADQAEIVAQARVRLAALAGPGAGGGLVTRRILADASGVGDFLTADGKYINQIDWKTGDVVQFEVASGQPRRIKNGGPWGNDDQVNVDHAFSRDGKQIAYIAEVRSGAKQWDTLLRIRNLDGSGLRTLYSERDYIEPLDWSPDGRAILTSRYRENERAAADLVLISTGDGSVRALRNTPAGFVALNRASFSPDGRYIAFGLQREGPTPHGDVFLMTADGRDEVVIAGHPADEKLLGWTPDGKSLIFLSDRTGTWDVWNARITGGKQQGESELLKRDFGSGSKLLGFAPDGSLYYKSVTRLGGLFSGAIDLETGKVLVPPAPVATRYTGPLIQPAWSPDGRNLAYISRWGSGMLGSFILTIRSAEMGEERFLKPRLLFINQISWGPDNRSIIAVGGTLAGFGIFRIDAETSEVTKLADNGVAPRLCPDGKTLVYVKEGPIVVKRNLDTGAESDVVEIRGLNYDLSPDGKDVVFWMEDAVKIASLNGGEPREVYRGPAKYARWTGDGRRIIVQGGGSHWLVPAQGGTPLKLDLAVPKMMFFTVHPDNRRFVFSVNEGVKSELWVMENFLPPLKAAK